jgi:hypothetical protein
MTNTNTNASSAPAGVFDGLDGPAREAAAFAIVSDCDTLVDGLRTQHSRVVDNPKGDWRARTIDFAGYVRSLAALLPALDALVGAEPTMPAVTLGQLQDQLQDQIQDLARRTLVPPHFDSSVGGAQASAPERDARDKLLADLLGHVRQALPLVPDHSPVGQILRRAVAGGPDVGGAFADAVLPTTYMLPPKVANGVMLAVSFRLSSVAESLNNAPIFELQDDTGDLYKVAGDARAVAALAAVGDQLQWRAHWGMHSDDPVGLAAPEATLITILEAASERYRDSMRGDDSDRDGLEAEREMLLAAKRHIATLIGGTPTRSESHLTPEEVDATA